MDLEMTGLDSARHVIVEIATLVTDDDLKVLAEGPDLVVAAPAEALATMEEPVRSMHAKSGLLAAVEASSVSLEAAGAATLEFLAAHIPQPRSVPLCGNSIGTDRRFLAAYLPAVNEYLHYRSIDVSSIKELCRRWYPAEARQAPRKAGGHRALDDIRESVAELAYYRRAIFRPAGTAAGPAGADEAEGPAGQDRAGGPAGHGQDEGPAGDAPGRASGPGGSAGTHPGEPAVRPG